MLNSHPLHSTCTCMCTLSTCNLIDHVTYTSASDKGARECGVHCVQWRLELPRGGVRMGESVLRDYHHCRQGPWVAVQRRKHFPQYLLPSSFILILLSLSLSLHFPPIPPFLPSSSLAPFVSLFSLFPAPLGLPLPLFLSPTGEKTTMVVMDCGAMPEIDYSIVQVHTFVCVLV